MTEIIFAVGCLLIIVISVWAIGEVFAQSIRAKPTPEDLRMTAYQLRKQRRLLDKLEAEEKEEHGKEDIT